jgi:hypothetical protein
MGMETINQKKTPLLLDSGETSTGEVIERMFIAGLLAATVFFAILGLQH